MLGGHHVRQPAIHNVLCFTKLELGTRFINCLPPLTVKMPQNTDADDCHVRCLVVLSPLQGAKRLMNLAPECKNSLASHSFIPVYEL